MRPWGGIEDGCLVNVRTDKDNADETEEHIMTKEVYDVWIKSRTTRSSNKKSASFKAEQLRKAKAREPCITIDSPPVNQDQFMGKRFCGFRSGEPFTEAVRPVQTGKMGQKDAYACPEGFVPCSEETSADNTICEGATKDKSVVCPITMMKFIPKEDESKYPDSDYTVQSVDETNSFVYSKTKGDSLPLTSFNIESKPCLDPSLISSGQNEEFYLLEVDQTNSDCVVDDYYGVAYDSRYEDLGLSISEYDVQNESYVLQKLNHLPKSSEYVSEDSKKSNMYTFWARPTISWDIKCDEKYPRSSVVEAVSFEEEKKALDETEVMVLSIAAFSLGIVCSFAIMIFYCTGSWRRSEWTKGNKKTALAFGLVFQSIVLAMMTSTLFGQKGELAERKIAIENLAMVNECGDEFTKIPENYLPDIIEADNKTLFNIIAACVSAALSLITLGSCAMRVKSDEDGSDDEIDYQKLD